MHIPTELQQAGVTFPAETRALYERVIAERAVLTVHKIDEYGFPWVAYPNHSDATDWFAVNHSDGIELVERSYRPTASHHPHALALPPNNSP